MSTVNEKMTAIADQIRTLIGTTGAMGLDAMATNLTTANSAVASAKTAITDKGVSVPDGAGVDDLAALIASIICPDVSKVTAAAGNVLAGKVFVDANGNAVTGTMTNRGAVSASVAAGGTYTIPAGYHNGSGKVTSAASSGYKTTSGTFTPTGTEPSSYSITHGLGKVPVFAVAFLRANWSLNGITVGSYIVLSSEGGTYTEGGTSLGGTSGSLTTMSSTAVTFRGELAPQAYYYYIVG